MTSTPKYRHDCDRCVFLEHYLGQDLYFCAGEPTVVARQSSDPPDYSSGLIFAERQPASPLGKAHTLAIKRGLFKEEAR